MNSERTVCQIFPATTSACLRSLGVVSVAKLCHVCMKMNPYVRQERRGECGESLCFMFFHTFSTDKTRGIKHFFVIVHSIPLLGGQNNKPTSEQMVKELTMKASPWLINVWPCKLSLNDVSLCLRGLLKLGYPSLLC